MKQRGYICECGGPEVNHTRPTLILTCVLLRSHFSRGLDGVNSDTSLPSSSKILEFSCLITWKEKSA